MKINIANPSMGTQKIIEVDDENILRNFYDKRMAQEVDGGVLGTAYKGYVFRISGGNDKQGFPMKQGLLTASRVRLLLTNGHTCYRPRKTGERKRKSIRGAIVSSELSVMNLVVVQKGDKDIEGLTTKSNPARRGPKRASKIRKMFNLEKKDNIQAYVIRRRIAKEGQKAYYKKPTIQRLVTPERLTHRRHHRHALKERHAKKKADAEDFNKIIQQKYKDAKEKRAALLQKRRSKSATKSASTNTKTTSTTSKPIQPQTTALPTKATKTQ
jgi:small subunit ribosomal protein S6e